MSKSDVVILLVVKALDGLVVALGLLAAILWLAWWIYRQIVGWPVIVKAMLQYKEKGRADN